MRFFAVYFLCISAFALDPSSELLFWAGQTEQDPALNPFLSEFPYDNYKICCTEDSDRFYIDNGNDTIKGTLKRGSSWEPMILNLINFLAKSGSIVLDVGALIGTHTMAMAKRVGPKGLVIAFEPQLKIFRELYHNTELNNHSHNTILLHNAVGDKEQMVEMGGYGGDNEGGVGIGKGGDTAYMITVDHLNLSNVSFIKMDVEGHEFKVLQGAEETILRNKPVIVFEVLGLGTLNTGLECTEINAPGAGVQNYNEIIGFLRSVDYFVFRIDETNFIAFPRLPYEPHSRHHFQKRKYRKIKTVE